jgi:hypothetical protein
MKKVIYNFSVVTSAKMCANVDIRIVKVRKPHSCAYCQQTISKGENAKTLLEVGSRVHYAGGEYPFKHRSFYRRYWHPNCPLKIKRTLHITEMTDEQFELFINSDSTEGWEKAGIIYYEKVGD